MTSGTATLETALLNVPEVVVYRTLWFQVKLQPYVLKVPYVSLVNLNLGRESVVEIIQSDLDITRAERELRAILTGGEKRERMLRDFAVLQAVIGAPGASGPDGGAAEKTGAVRCANCSRHTRRNSSAEGCWSCSAFWFGFSRT